MAPKSTGISVRFNKKFYNLESVKKSAKQFRSLADLKISDSKSGIDVRVVAKKPFSDSLIADELKNYALAEMKDII